MDPDEKVTNKVDIGTDVLPEVYQYNAEQTNDDLNIDKRESIEDRNSAELDTTSQMIVSNDYKTRLGFTSEDVADGFVKWLTGCAGSKSKLLDEDQEIYGFSERRTHGKGMVSRLKRQVSERISRRSKPPERRYERSKSHEDKPRSEQSKRQDSYKEAVNESINNTITPLNNSVTVSSESQRVPPNTTSGISNDLGTHNNAKTVHYYAAYPCQTNIQSYPNTRYRKKDNPIVVPDVYNFSFPERGYLVNIVNDHFVQQSKRDGAHWDLLKMREIGRKFGFRLFNYQKDRNLTRNQTLSLLTEIQAVDHSKCDCFMFMISSHGLQQRNPGAGGKLDHALVCADDQLIFTSTIIKMFNDRNCPSLKGKPKIFFIQACRGEQLDHGADVSVVYPRSVDRADITSNLDQKRGHMRKKESVDEYDTRPGQDSWTQQYGGKDVQYTSTTTGNPHTNREPNPSTSMASGSQQFPAEPRFCAPKYSQFPTAATIQNTYTIAKVPFNPGTSAHRQLPFPIVDTPSLRCSNDMLVMYAIPQGMFAWRSQTDGSWMIDYLHQILMSHNMNSPKNFLSMLTKVSSIMSERSTHTPSLPEMDKKKAIPVIEHKLDKDIIFKPKVTGSDWVRQTQKMYL